MKKGSAVITSIICFLFIFLFTYTALNKLVDLPVFASTLSKSPLVGEGGKWLIYIIPGVELMVVTLLFFPRLQYAGLVGSLVLMILFTLYVGYLLLFFGGALPCSCGGILQQLTWPQHFWINLALTCAAAIAVWHRGRRLKMA